jgi:hypothetical protein
MNISKKVAELRSELELLEASIHDFESLEKARQSSEVLTKKPVKSIATASGCQGADLLPDL